MTTERNGHGKMERKVLVKSHSHFSSIMSDSHCPSTANMKTIANLNDMWLMIGATFLSLPPGLPHIIKPLM
jgi:hypothetical protein